MGALYNSCGRYLNFIPKYLKITFKVSYLPHEKNCGVEIGGWIWHDLEPTPQRLVIVAWLLGSGEDGVV